LRDPSRGSAVSWERRYIGAYRYLCGKCGKVMRHIVATHAGGHRYHRYTCTASPHLTRAQPALDSYVEGLALEYLQRDDALALLLADNKADAMDVDGLRTRRAALQAKHDELATLFTDGVFDGPAVRRESAKLNTQIAGIDTTLADAAASNPAADLLADGPELVAERWAAMSADLKGKVLDGLFTVVINPSPRGNTFNHEYIDIRWHGNE